MGVLWGTHSAENECPYHENVRSGGQCFYCLRVLEYPCIYWAGVADVFLHAQCAALLSTSLMADWKRVHDGREAQMNQRKLEQRLQAALTQAQVEQAVLQDEVEKMEWALQKLRQEGESQREQIERMEREREVLRLFEASPAIPRVEGIRVDPQRAFTALQKKEIYLRSNGHCVGCGTPLDSDWHADHIMPHARGGRTEIVNGQALCQPCNSRKHAKVLTVDG